MSDDEEFGLGDEWPMDPPDESGSRPWPTPTGIVYPMKPSDSIDANGVLYSGALRREKAEQHPGRFVVKWVKEASRPEGRWIIQRLPLSPVESADFVAGERDITRWRRRARQHQHAWREAQGLPHGHLEIRGSNPSRTRPIASRIEIEYAREHAANFLTPAITAAVRARLATPETYQTIDQDRLWGDLLSSMPMCFNLFGPLHGDSRLALHAVRTWFPEVAGDAAWASVGFEWSPGRRDPRFLGDRTAFDAVLFAGPSGTEPGARHTVIGIETKYHEAPTKPSKKPINPRYDEVSNNSRLFATHGAMREVTTTELEQVWRDHLLALSCLQAPDGWQRAKYVVVAPAGNPAWKRLVEQYRRHLTPEAASTVEYRSLEDLLESGVLPHTDLFRARYLPTD